MSPINSVAWFPEDSGMFYSCCFDEVHIWDTLNFEKVLSFNIGHKVSQITPSKSDPGIFAVASDSHCVRICNVETGSCLESLVGHKGPVLCAEWSNKDFLLYTSSKDETIKLWDIRMYREIKNYKIGHVVDGVSVYCNSVLLLHSVNKTSVFCVSSEKHVHEFKSSSRRVVSVNDWFLHIDDSKIVLADLINVELQLQINQVKPTYLAWNDKEMRLWSGAEDGSLRLWEPNIQQ